MNRLAQPASNKLDFALFALAVSAVNGCETCVQAHERVRVTGRLTEAQIHDTVRIAAVANDGLCAARDPDRGRKKPRPE
jgi:alkyl hydroperoxide reductase subunit D